MEYVIAAFRSRSETVKFYNYLKSFFIPCELINTPKEAGVGCGLSVKTEVNYLYALKRAVSNASPSSFAGFFVVAVRGKSRTVRLI